MYRATPDTLRAVPVLVVGVLAMSSASIMIRVTGAPALAIATYRLILASLLVGLALVVRTGPIAPRRVLSRWTVLSGLFLTLHFATWISSLDYTTVASSVVLVQTSPVFVGLSAGKLLGEKPVPLQWLGIALAIVGGAAIVGTDFSASSEALKGDLLALAGAVGGAGYWVCGRAARRDMDTPHYVVGAYSVSAAALLVLSLLTGTPLTGFPLRDYVLMTLIAIVPQGIGHTAFNWSLRQFSATAVSVFALGEPVGAGLLAYVLLAEAITPERGLGALVVLTGVFLTIRAEPARSSVESARASRRPAPGRMDI